MCTNNMWCCLNQHILLKIKKTILKFTLTKYLKYGHCLCLFSTAETVYQCYNARHYTIDYLYLHDSYISKVDSMIYIFANLVVSLFYTSLTNLSTEYLVTWEVYTDVGGIK